MFERHGGGYGASEMGRRLRSSATVGADFAPPQRLNLYVLGCGCGVGLDETGSSEAVGNVRFERHRGGQEPSG